ncbi:hypothetical protein C8J57DRAFT_1612072 [Mycena rebaudengoi]|nr:hypothetical protein C8J57DRAFT_1612072 [Mycena rebaudengoi]
MTTGLPILVSKRRTVKGEIMGDHLIPASLLHTMTTSPQLVSREIVNEYHRFRILVVGKAGVGKSSLIHYAFGVTTHQTISAESRGVCKIDDELISEQNRLFVLHDSMGFEPGQEENLEEAKLFLERRSDSRVPIHARVLPTLGGVFLKPATKLSWTLQQRKIAIPLIVVFTQFDKLFNAYFLAPNAAPNGSLSDPKFRARCLKLAEAEFKMNSELCKTVEEDERQSTDSAPAKSRDAEDDCLCHIMVLYLLTARVGYWSGLAAGAKFMGMKLDNCVEILHSEIIATWNFLDDEHLLENPEFVTKMRKLVQFVVPGESETTSWFGQNLDKVYKLVGISAAIAAAAAGPTAPIAVPAIAGVSLSVLFAAYLARAYHSVPETLRCRMAYIVDLTLIMEELFHIALAFRPIRTLAMEDIELAMDNYMKPHAEKVHSEIRTYTKASKLSKIMRPQKAEEELLAQRRPMVFAPAQTARVIRWRVSQTPTSQHLALLGSVPNVDSVITLRLLPDRDFHPATRMSTGSVPLAAPPSLQSLVPDVAALADGDHRAPPTVPPRLPPLHPFLSIPDSLIIPSLFHAAIHLPTPFVPSLVFLSLAQSNPVRPSIPPMRLSLRMFLLGGVLQSHSLLSLSHFDFPFCWATVIARREQRRRG